MEHFICPIVHDQKIYDWFYTNGVVTSCHSMVSRVLQFDVDGDQLNVIVDPLFIKVAEKNIKEFDVVPLFYDAEKGDATLMSKEAQFEGLKIAHEYSGIGEISNMLTRLWNRNTQDRIAAAFLCRFNNAVIDAAKIAKINHYNQYPEIEKRINKAIGGKNSRMPAWFKYSKNQRKNGNEHKQYAKPNNSTMNRISSYFDDIGKINMNFAGVPSFNWQMLLSGPCTNTWPEIPMLFCEMDNVNISNVIESHDIPYASEKQKINGYSMMAEMIKDEIIDQFGSLETAYPYVVKHLFAGEGMNKAAHKQMFWRVFGNIALENLKKNVNNCDVCPDCKMRIPSWVKDHYCVKNTSGFYECIDCHKMCERTSSSQYRCADCQNKYRLTQRKLAQRNRRNQLKEDEEKRIVSWLSSFREI